jgi:hypothetical protein
MLDLPVGRTSSPALSETSTTSTHMAFSIDSQATQRMNNPDDHWGPFGNFGNRVRDLWTSQP